LSGGGGTDESFSICWGRGGETLKKKSRGGRGGKLKRCPESPLTETAQGCKKLIGRGGEHGKKKRNPSEKQKTRGFRR